MAASVVLHAGVIAALFFLHSGSPPPSAPIIKVQLIAGPAGERSAGVVRETPQPQPAAPAPLPATKTTMSTKKNPPVKEKTKATKAPVVATPESPTIKPPET